MNTNWILRHGSLQYDCTSFPFAYRQAFNLVRKQIEAKKPTAALMADLTILGPALGPRGERKKYSYAAATQFAQETGLLTPEGTINSREFKRKF